LLPIYSELVNPNYDRITKVIRRSLFVDYLFYTIVAGAGYLSFFNTVNPIIIVNYSVDGVDYWMIVGALAVCLIMVASLPVNFHPWRF